MTFRKSMGALVVIASMLSTACGEGDPSATDSQESVAMVEQEVTYPAYSASSTNYATDPNNSADFPIYLNAGEGIVVGTCGVKGASASAYTTVRLYNPSNVSVAYSYHTACAGGGARFTYVAPTAGMYTIRAGCYSSYTCNGTVAVGKRKNQFSYSAQNTASATNNYNSQYVYANGGERLVIGTCDLPGAAYTGDTYLRLYNLSTGTQVAFNDNGTGHTTSCGTGSKISYDVATTGYYEVRSGCTTNGTCSGTVSVVVE